MKKLIVGTIIILTTLIFSFYNPFSYKDFSNIIAAAIGISIFIIVVLSILLFIFNKPINSIRKVNGQTYFLVFTWLLVLLIFFIVDGKNNSKNSLIIRGISSCKNGIKSSFYLNHLDTLLNVDKYCECAVSKVFENKAIDFTKAKDEIFDFNSVTFNEILLPCAKDALFHAPNKQSIVGFVPTDTVPVMPTNYGLKVKVIIDSFVYYFILDSGASEMIISESILKKILLANSQIIIKELPYQNFIIANGESVKCRRIVLEQIKFGKFLIPDVTFAIMPNEVLPLLGRNVLDRFKSWSLIDDNKGLVLTR